jgi:hypothetical protein
MADAQAGLRSRRSILATAAGGAAAAIAAALGRPLAARAGDGDAVLVGQEVTATESTTIRNTTTTKPVLIAHSDLGTAIAGTGMGEGTSGVHGTADGGVGVLGASQAGVGTGGSSAIGTGVRGQSQGGGTGIHALADLPGTALRVEGKLAFSRSGVVTIAAGKSSVTKAVTGLTPGSLVFAVVKSGDSGAWVRRVSTSAGSFDVALNKAVTTRTIVAWFAIG